MSNYLFSVNELQDTPINDKNTLTKLHTRKEKKKRNNYCKYINGPYMLTKFEIQEKDCHYITQYWKLKSTPPPPPPQKK